jgi:uncharacterized protein (DUF983 family)
MHIVQQKNKMGKFITAIQLKCPRCGKGELYGDAGILPQKGMFSMLTMEPCIFLTV